MQKTSEADAADESSSFIFTVCVKSVALYNFKPAYVVLQMAVKEFFSKPSSKNGEIGRFNYRVILADLEMSLIHSI